MPEFMRQIHFDRFGAPEVLRLVEAPVPEPAAGQVRVHVAAAGVNRADLAQREGSYAPPPGASPVLGLEVSGTVDAVGPGVANNWIGREVCSLTAGGGYAEWVCVPAAHCMPLPPGLGLIEAAAFPEAAMTVWSNVMELGALVPGQSLLVHGGTSGIGAFTVALARALGHTVLATAGGAGKCRVLDGWGARAINYLEQDFAARVLDLTGGRGVDVILDMVAGSYVAREIDCLAEDGRLVIIAVQGGVKAEFNAGLVLRRRLTITGSTLRPRPVAFKAAIARSLRERVWPLLAAGTITPVIHQVFEPAQAADAHALMESNRHIGKLMLRWS